MTQFSTPWVERNKPNLSAIEKLMVGVAMSVAGLAAPILRRFPAAIFFGAVAGGVVGIYLVALLSEAFLGEYHLLRDILAVTGVSLFAAHIPLFAIWWERKVAARIQSRMGPMRVGGWHGWAQSMADGIKLIAKEDLVPAAADAALFRLAPYVTLIPVVIAFLTLPFGAHWIFRNMDVGLLVIVAMLGVEVVGVIMAGWGSNSKWTVYGAMREACQMVSYEIPMGISLLLPVLTIGSLNLVQIGDAQAGGWHTWLAFQSPFMFVAAVAYYITSLASCKRAPFDLPESESELVAGFLTEYSGIRWSLFFFAEYVAMYIVAALAVVLFFGGWSSPISPEWIPDWMGRFLFADNAAARAAQGLILGGPIWMVVKSFFLVFVQMWVRWTLPRIRIDQVLYSCIQVLLPLMLVLLIGQTLWVLWVPEDSLLAMVTRIALSSFTGLAGLGACWIIFKARLKKRALVGVLAVEQLPGA